MRTSNYIYSQVASANLLATKPVCEDVATDWLNQDNNTWYMKILTGS